MNDIIGRDLLLKIFVGSPAQVLYFLLVNPNRARITAEINIGCADQGKVVLVGNGKNDSAVAVLKDVGTGVIK